MIKENSEPIPFSRGNHTYYGYSTVEDQLVVVLASVALAEDVNVPVSRLDITKGEVTVVSLTNQKTGKTYEQLNVSTSLSLDERPIHMVVGQNCRVRLADLTIGGE